jgi:hypothetical protein
MSGGAHVDHLHRQLVKIGGRRWAKSSPYRSEAEGIVSTGNLGVAEEVERGQCQYRALQHNTPRCNTSTSRCNTLQDVGHSTTRCTPYSTSRTVHVARCTALVRVPSTRCARLHMLSVCYVAAEHIELQHGFCTIECNMLFNTARPRSAEPLFRQPS